MTENTSEVTHAVADAAQHVSAPGGYVVHEVAHHAAEAHHEAHELPHFLEILKGHFPESLLINFLHDWQNIFFSLLAAGVICFFFLKAARQKELVPTGIRNFVEAIVEGLETFVIGILGEPGRRHVPYLGTIFIYILLMNWSGMIPFMKSPTANWSITVAIALITMVYVQATGVKEQGLAHYLKHLAGNPSNVFGFILIPLMLAINVILEFGAVPFSLSLRLFANVSSEDRLLLNFAQLATSSPYYIAFPFQLVGNILALVFGFVQAFVFMLLSTVYISLVMPHEDHGQDHEAEHAHAH